MDVVCSDKRGEIDVEVVGGGEEKVAREDSPQRDATRDNGARKTSASAAIVPRRGQ